VQTVVTTVSRMTWARRVTVVTPQARVDVALPPQSTIAELLPQLVRLSEAGQQAERDQGGWVLTRFGGAPLSPGLTVAAAGLRDGDVLYLNPRERKLPPMLFDDVVDAIASAGQASPGAWQARAARLAGITAAAAALIGATLLLFSYLSGRGVAPIVGANAALVLLVSAALLRRALGDATAGAVCATVGAAPAAMAGMSALRPHDAWSTGAQPLALGLAAVAAYGVLTLILVSHWSSWFGCLAVAAGLGAVTTAVVSLTGTRPAWAAAVAAVVATALTPAAPMIAMRLSRLPLPRVPSDMDAFQATDSPALGPDVLDQTATAQRLLTGLLAALGLVVVGAVVLLLRGDHPDQAALAGALGVVWLLRSRSYASTSQRVVLLAAGLLSLAGLGIWLAVGHHRVEVAGGAGALAIAAVACIVYAHRTGAGRRSPYWSRLLDVAEFFGVVSLLPLAGLVLSLYEHIRHAVH
jgi:type VII secretion integral membrane protein EccD